MRMTSSMLHQLKHAALIAAGAFVAALQAEGVANEVGGYGILVAGLLGIAAGYIKDAEGGTN